MKRTRWIHVATAASFYAAAPAFAGTAAEQLRGQAAQLGVDVGAATQAPAPRSAPEKPDSVGAWLGTGLEHLCFDALQRFYYSHERFVDWTMQFNKLADPITHRCDLKQPLFNFQKLSDGVYRSGRPTGEGLDRLKTLGVKTILDLNADAASRGPSEAQAAAAKGLGFADVAIDWTKWPTYEELDRALAVLTDPARQPVLVHCTCGYDRTGIVAAAYRVVVQGWTPRRADEEAKKMGWHYPLCGDLTSFLASYAEHRAGAAGAK